MQLIEGWAEKWWKLWSVRLAMLAGVISGWAATDPQGFARLMESVPEQYRPLLGLLVFLAATFTRLKKQGDGNA